MNTNKLILIFFAILGLLISTEASAKESFLENPIEDCQIKEKKIYLHPHQLHLTSSGYACLFQGELMLIDQLYSDEEGLFCLIDRLDTITDRCALGHKIWCWSCLGCVVRICPRRCRCVEWE